MRLIPTAVRRGFDATLHPIARAFIGARVNPNTLTTIGTLVPIAGGWLFGIGWIRTGGALVLLAGVFDVLDGMVARFGKGTTRFGAFYDSTLDRVGEVAMFTGVAVYSLNGGVPPHRVGAAVLLCMIALGASLTVSYARARAEGLGVENAGGLIQRAERILILGIPTLLFGSGRDGWLLLGIVALLAAASSITVVQRIVHVYQATRGETPSGKGRIDQ